jgi:hypothetical protein
MPIAVAGVLEQHEWGVLEALHHDRVDRLLAGHRERAGRGERHPVEDFLFTYYSHRPARLRRWHPGVGVLLVGADERLAWRDYVRGDGGAVGLDVPGFLDRRGDAVRHVRELLTATAARPAQLGCFGLHEWAMVYRLAPGDVRHAGLPLRLGSAGTDAVVESHRIRCSHHDAFRFFTAPARPLNALTPTRDTTVRHEQPGCLHVTMDLYKWAYKLGPAVPGDLLLDCFELARDVRALDMRASPYDLRHLGYDPVPIETADGKAQYATLQRGFAERARPLRARLLAVCEALERAGHPTPH